MVLENAQSVFGGRRMPGGFVSVLRRVVKVDKD